MRVHLSRERWKAMDTGVYRYVHIMCEYKIFAVCYRKLSSTQRV